MNAVARRGACPALSAPMMTGDGLLVRLNPTASELPPKTLIGLCKSALRHGNGIVEITARGSFQIRGLTPQSAALLAEDVNALGIAVRTGVPVETGPLAGLDLDEIADPRPVADAIRKATGTAGLSARLGPKASVVVDGGGHSGLDEVLADVLLTAVQGGEHSVWRLATGGNAKTAQFVGDFAEMAAVEATISILQAIAALGVEARAKHLGNIERLHSALPPSVLTDISLTRGEIAPAALLSPIANIAGKMAAPKLPISPLRGEMSGRTKGGPKEHDAGSVGDLLPLHDARVALPLALPFGSMEASALISFIETAEKIGATEIRLAPRRTLLLLTSSAEAAEAIRTIAGNYGLLTSSTDPRLHIAACSGAPACASGKLATRDVAMETAQDAVALLDGSVTVHVSGCAKGCAHPGPAGLAIVGGENGAGLVVNGTAGHTPLAYTRPDGLPAALARLARERAAGETAAACLTRLGPAKVAAFFEGRV